MRVLMIPVAALSATGCATLEGWAANPDEPLVEVVRIDPRIVIDIRYATEDNFMHRVLYPAPRCLLRESVARRLSRVQDDLAAEGLSLKVYDGYRPLSVQKLMWAVMPDERYVADPAKGSRHNRGAAVDVTLVDASSRDLEMPSAYDEFSERAHSRYGGGTPQARANRDRLIRAMHRHGFRVLETEWWHFDAPGWKRYPVMDLPLDSMATTQPAGAGPK